MKNKLFWPQLFENLLRSFISHIHIGQILRRETHEECTMLILLLTFPLPSSSEGERCKFESLPTYEASALWRHDPTYGLMDHPQNWGLPPGGGVMLICQHWDHLIIITIKIWPRSICNLQDWGYQIFAYPAPFQAAAKMNTIRYTNAFLVEPQWKYKS